ncbi:methyltransferase family protein [Azospirillum sp. sgz302134]
MPEAFLRWFPLVCMVYFQVATILRLWWLRKHTGVNAMEFEPGDNAHTFLGLYFKGVVAFTSVYVLARAVWWPGLDLELGYIPGMAALGAAGGGLLHWLGFAGMIVAAVAMTVGHHTMGRSWRIGVDLGRKTDLVTSGPFRISRNPIFGGVAGYAIGLFILAPTAVSLAIMVSYLLSINVAVRLEEEHLANLHGDVYRQYRQRVRRWI